MALSNAGWRNNLELCWYFHGNKIEINVDTGQLIFFTSYEYSQAAVMHVYSNASPVGFIDNPIKLLSMDRVAALLCEVTVV